MNIGKNLSSIRKEHGMTQQELAEKLNVSRQAVSRWEQAVSEPSTENLIRIGKLFGVSVDALIGNGVQEEKQMQEEVAEQELNMEHSEKRRNCMRGKLSIFNRNVYLVLAAILLFYDLVCAATYPNPKLPSVLKSVFVVRAMGPVFSFFLVTYLSLAVLHYADKWKKFPEVLRLLSVFLVAAVWILLCYLLRGYTFLLSRSYFGLFGSVYSIILYLLKSRKGETPV